MEQLRAQLTAATQQQESEAAANADELSRLRAALADAQETQQMLRDTATHQQPGDGTSPVAADAAAEVVELRTALEASRCAAAALQAELEALRHEAAERQLLGLGGGGGGDGWGDWGAEGGDGDPTSATGDVDGGSASTLRQAKEEAEATAEALRTEAAAAVGCAARLQGQVWDAGHAVRHNHTDAHAMSRALYSSVMSPCGSLCEQHVGDDVSSPHNTRARCHHCCRWWPWQRRYHNKQRSWPICAHS